MMVHLVTGCFVGFSPSLQQTSFPVQETFTIHIPYYYHILFHRPKSNISSALMSVMTDHEATKEEYFYLTLTHVLQLEPFIKVICVQCYLPCTADRRKARQ